MGDEGTTTSGAVRGSAKTQGPYGSGIGGRETGVPGVTCPTTTSSGTPVEADPSS